MKNHFQNIVYLKGSGTSVKRSVYEDENGKFFVKYYGELIEVERHGTDFRTVEAY